MAMDQDVRDGLADIKLSVREGFSDMTKRLDDLVTKGEFNATVKRIDNELQMQHQAISDHDKQSEEYKSRAANTESELRAAAQKDAAAVQSELHTSLEQMRAALRWGIGIAATISGIIVSVVSTLLTHFGK